MSGSGQQNAFDDAVIAHEQWKRVFLKAILSGGADLEVEIVERDDRCPLGQWLVNGAHDQVTNEAAYQMLCSVHASFHRAAARVLSVAQSGWAEHALRAELAGSYSEWSETLETALRGYANAEGGPPAEPQQDSRQQAPDESEAGRRAAWS